jgi:hypothetical protein
VRGIDRPVQLDPIQALEVYPAADASYDIA